MKHLLGVGLFVFLVITGLAQKTYLQCGQFIDVRNLQVVKEKTIIIEGNKITDIVDGYQSGTSADKVVNLKTSTVMPGLMDMHVHIENETNPNRYLEGFTQSQADIAYGSLRFAERDLMAGFTSVRDLGGSGANIAMRKAIQKGYVVGPRIYTAGKSIATTGGHADPTNNYRPDLMGDPGPKEGVINGPEDAYKAVRQRYKEGSDLIKITASGGVLSMATNGENPQFTEEEVKAIVGCEFNVCNNMRDRSKQDNGFQIPGSGSADHHLACARGKMCFGLCFIGKKAGAFEHDVHAEVLPGQLRRILLRKHPDAVAVDDE